ncbi:hypothetical protein CEE37_06115 [candidate division LCP-89 bacterium B3_LCP]|uniref:SHSP domain-containing protein n=1 Tax=candidate division LCP-89 bacterium B3_LCP TaxID=2012998 RepID=A0A532V248_UNCL8|nr:MAG: hypothetical protein CEE37_06115 [candidate division LCP-89 bacterium B3_LCP]
MERENDTHRLIKDFQTLSEDIDLLMQSFIDDTHPVPGVGRGYLPAMDIFETETEMACLLELAGVAPQDVQIKLQNRTLLISGVRREIPGFDQRKYHKMELDFGCFERTLVIPEPVKPKTLQWQNLGGFYLIRIEKKFPGLTSHQGTIKQDNPDTRR